MLYPGGVERESYKINKNLGIEVFFYMILIFYLIFLFLIFISICQFLITKEQRLRLWIHGG